MKPFSVTKCTSVSDMLKLLLRTHGALPLNPQVLLNEREERGIDPESEPPKIPDIPIRYQDSGRALRVLSPSHILSLLCQGFLEGDECTMADTYDCFECVS